MRLKTEGATTPSIMALAIMTLHNENQPNNTENATLSIMTFDFYAECRLCLVSQLNPLCRYSDCRGAKV